MIIGIKCCNINETFRKKKNIVFDAAPNILIQKWFTVISVSSVSILHLLRLGGWWWCASVSGSVFSVLCGAPAELSISNYTVPDTPLAGLPKVSTLLHTDVHTHTHTLTYLTHYSPLRRTTFTAIHQFQPQWRCDICVDPHSVPLNVNDLCCATWCKQVTTHTVISALE